MCVDFILIIYIKYVGSSSAEYCNMSSIISYMVGITVN